MTSKGTRLDEPDWCKPEVRTDPCIATTELIQAAEVAASVGTLGIWTAKITAWAKRLWAKRKA